MIRRLYHRLRYGTTDPDRIECKKRGHSWVDDGPTTLIVPADQTDTFADVADRDGWEVATGPPLPEGQHTWAPTEVSDQRCQRCDEVRSHRTP